MNKLSNEDLEKVKEDMFTQQLNDFAKTVDPALAEKFRSKDTSK